MIKTHIQHFAAPHQWWWYLCPVTEDSDGQICNGDHSNRVAYQKKCCEPPVVNIPNHSWFFPECAIQTSDFDSRLHGSDYPPSVHAASSSATSTSTSTSSSSTGLTAQAVGTNNVRCIRICIFLHDLLHVGNFSSIHRQPLSLTDNVNVVVNPLHQLCFGPITTQIHT